MADPYYMSTHTDPEDGDPTALAQLEANAAIMENEPTSRQARTRRDPAKATSRARNITESALEELNPEALFMDGLDSAIVGWGCQYSKNTVVVYNEDDIIEHLTETEGLSYEEAWEHYSYNIAGAWVGENTPIIIRNVNDWVDWEG
jgi:hypothetical protein